MDSFMKWIISFASYVLIQAQVAHYATRICLKLKKKKKGVYTVSKRLKKLNANSLCINALMTHAYQQSTRMTAETCPFGPLDEIGY